MKRVVSYSGGLGSFAAAYQTIQKHGADACLLVFTDTKTEDEDLYRFLNETSLKLGVPLLTIADGRNIWEVFTDVRFMGNSRIDPCSRILKRDLFKKWMRDNYSPDQATLVVGISADESHRTTAIRKNWEPYQVEAPLCDAPMSKEDIEDILDSMGITPPRLYAQGFPHNNCGGFCVKTGQRQMKLLLEKNPDRYAWHEEQQEKLFAIIGKRHGFIRKEVDGVIQYLGLKEFRGVVESGGQVEMFREDGCGCFL